MVMMMKIVGELTGMISNNNLDSYTDTPYDDDDNY